MSNKRQKLRKEAAYVKSEKDAQKAKEADDAFPALTLGKMTVPAFDGLSAAFGARLNDYPKLEDIPAEFRKHDGRFQSIFSKLFFNGGKLEDHGLKLKTGISHRKAMTAIRAYMSSFDPKHEHKTATVAWALSEWTEAI